MGISSSQRLVLLSSAMISLAFSGEAAADVSYAYDDLGRVTSIQYDDGRLVSYAYDAAGNRTQHVVSQGPNRTPIAINDGMTIDVTQGYSDQIDPRVNDRDPDFNTLSVTSKTDGTQGTVTIIGGGTAVQYLFTGQAPNVGHQKLDTFTYTVSDGNGGTAVANVNVTIIQTPGEPPCGGPGEPICP